MQPVTFRNLLSNAFAQIRQYGGDSVAVSIRLVEALLRVAQSFRTSEDLAAVQAQGEAVREAFMSNSPAKIDVLDFDRRFDQLSALWLSEDES